MRTAAKKRRTGSVFVMSCTYFTNILAGITIRFCHRGVSQLALPPGSLERGVIYRQSACLGAHILRLSHRGVTGGLCDIQAVSLSRGTYTPSQFTIVLAIGSH